MSASHADPFSWVGHTIDEKFRVEAVVGEGGFGVVYRALHLGLGVPVAVKCLKIPPSLPPEERDRFHQSFLDEGRLLRKLSRATHSVVQALDVGAAFAPNGAWVPYLVLEWLNGETLEALLARRRSEKKGGMPLAEAKDLLTPAALALGTAHDDGIAHRDVKPANLFLCGEESARTVKVLDFGIAKVIAENATLTRALEQTGQTPSMFTPFYGAPEQFNKRFGATGPWTDVYALALVLVELASGESPLAGDDVTQLYIATTDVAIRPTPRAHGVRTSDAVEAVFQKALAIEPRGRYASARAFWDALDAALAAPLPADEPPGDAARAPTLEPTLEAPRTTSGASVNARDAGQPGRRVLAILGALAIVGLSIGASALLRARAVPTEVPAVLRVGPELVHVDIPTTPADMVQVPAGRFTMGYAKGFSFEKPPHTVTISRPFYIDRAEVRADDYARCVSAKKCTPTGVHGPELREGEAEKFAPFCTEHDPAKASHPINCLDRAQAEAYCAFAGKRLPTEAEWEYAARGGEGARLYPWGDDEPTCEMGNFSRVAGQCGGRPKGTLPVGSFPDRVSPFGALDMAGNVWEWVADGFDPSAYAEKERKDPRASSGRKGVLRGGSWDFAATSARVTNRLAFDPGMGHVSTGVRCARTAD